MAKLPTACPVCEQPYADGSTYCAFCKLELTETKQNLCLNPKCENHDAYLPVRLRECPTCHGPTTNAEEINKLI